MYRKHFHNHLNPSATFAGLEAQKSTLMTYQKTSLAAPSALQRSSESSSVSSASTDSGRGITLKTRSTQNSTRPNAAVCSRADLEISELSVPLGWNSNEYFRSRERGPSYLVFAVLKTQTSVIDSQIISNVRRTDSDVTFGESFLFRNEPSDSVIQVQIYAAKNESYRNHQTISQFISRSLGRKFASSLNEDNYYGTVAASSISASPLNNAEKANFTLIAEGTLTCKHLSFDAKVYDLKKLCIESSPPLYGHFCCRFTARPKSLSKSLADGVVTIKAIDQNRLLQNVSCRLQRGLFRCYINNSQQHSDSHEQTLLQLVISEETRVKHITDPKSFQLDTVTETGFERFVISTDSERLAGAWIHAFRVQIADCDVWGDFATTSLGSAKPTAFDSAVTLSKLSGRRLYDQVETISERRMTNKPTSTHSKASPRHKERPHVQDLFETPYVKPYTYVLKLNVGKEDEKPESRTYTQPPKVPQTISYSHTSDFAKSGQSNGQMNASFSFSPGYTSTLPRMRSTTVSNFTQVPANTRTSTYFYDRYDYGRAASQDRSSRSRAEFRPLKELKKRLRKSLTNLIDRKVEFTKL
ncbi:hypothetical protein L596_003802 [Steinernema carpocapsae]|uniref:Anillin homology domain-containing protein n=1 Tax=Steinernema carpocapsae TaxID=34508 RepID=A0A4V6I858_STECR|nr:hypothetical protein L596_003802 [Steinernema carpocapsae]